MQDKGTFISPFSRPRCLAAAAPAGKAKLTHPGKAILAGKFIIMCHTERLGCVKMSMVVRFTVKAKFSKTVLLNSDTLCEGSFWCAARRSRRNSERKDQLDKTQHS